MSIVCCPDIEAGDCLEIRGEDGRRRYCCPRWFRREFCDCRFCCCLWRITMGCILYPLRRLAEAPANLCKRGEEKFWMYMFLLIAGTIATVIAKVVIGNSAVAAGQQAFSMVQTAGSNAYETAGNYVASYLGVAPNSNSST